MPSNKTEGKQGGLGTILASSRIHVESYRPDLGGKLVPDANKQKNRITMTPLANWKPCLADIQRGIAFFDGITIEADRITDPRWDRVLPVMEEEQVITCRMMTPLLNERKGARVLDVGTGSGVFAICAAEHGNAVVAIDINPRAIDFAYANCKKNKVQTTENHPKPGEIQFLECDYRTFASSSSSSEDQKFDFVLLNPPFNPTCEGFNPAVHANGGPLGQDCFLWQLPLAAKNLKKDGICVGVHMMLVKADGTLDAAGEIDRAFPGAVFEYTFILPPTPAAEFLRKQYQSHQQRVDVDVNGYIEKVPQGMHFALVYFEIRQNGFDSAGTKTEVKTTFSRPWTWEDDRVPFHRAVIDHTSMEHSIPATSLFMENLVVGDHIAPALQFLRGDKGQGANLEKSPLLVLDQILSSAGLIATPECPGAFKWLLIEAAPWYPTKKGRAELRSELFLWGSPDKLLAQGELILRRYIENTVRQQISGIAPFLHPYFTGSKDLTSWSGIHVSAHCKHTQKADLPHCSPFGEIVFDMLSAVDRTKVELGSIRNPILKNYHSCISTETPLSDLNVAKTKRYDGLMEIWLEKIQKVFESRSLKGLRPLAVDLDLRQQVMHRAIDKNVFSESLPLNGLYTSYFIGLPVTFRSPVQGRSGNQEDLPDSFRGGIWIHAIATDHWTLRAEQCLLDIARLLSLLYENQYSERVAQELRRIGHREATSSIFHQIPKDFGAIDKSLQELRDAVSSEQVEVETIRSLIPDTDAMAFMIMAADAAVGERSYQILPADIPEALEQGCTLEILQAIYMRLVEPYVGQRILRDDVERSNSFEEDRYELEEEERRIKYPFPVLELEHPFRIASARDAYIWLVLALRSAAYHAYYPIVTGQQILGRSRVGVRYSETRKEISVFNVAPPPKTGELAPQPGWRRDIEVFKRAGQAWKVRECQTEQYSCWDDSEELWITRIAFNP